VTDKLDGPTALSGKTPICVHTVRTINKVVAGDLESGVKRKSVYYMCLRRPYIPFHLDTGNELGNNTIIQGQLGEIVVKERNVADNRGRKEGRKYIIGGV
jgi:hypothetical protein